MRHLTLLIMTLLALPGCTFYPLTLREAPRPEGWPDLTPVGKIQVKPYPAYRAAVAAAPNGQATDNTLFRKLFSHISDRDIPMTAPVEMAYGDLEDPGQTDLEPKAMAFLYRSPSVGQTGAAEPGVEVIDIPAKSYVSIGVRGRYTDRRYRDRVERLLDWLADDPAGQAYEQVGPPRYLGYNSPFIPRFMRYAEVQIPVEPR
ncbi:MAG: heme-binding protein [Planctomycetota bacterium]